MRIAIAILAVAVITLSALFYRSEQSARQNQMIASNEVAAARAEVATVRAEMELQVGELHRQIATLDADRARDAQQLETLTNELNGARDALEQTKGKLEAAENEGARLAAEIEAVSNQLVNVEQKLAELQKTHEVTLGHFTAMREDYVRLTGERAQLEAKLHSLKALKAQINVVKQELHAQKVVERQRLDRAEKALGNGGFLMKDGQWARAPTPGDYPLTGEIHREK